MMKHTHIIMVGRTETTLQSWARDASTFALFAALIGLGVWLESSAMQWVGAAIASVILVAKALGLPRSRQFTPDGAHAEVDRIAALIEAEKK